MRATRTGLGSLAIVTFAVLFGPVVTTTAVAAASGRGPMSSTSIGSASATSGAGPTTSGSGSTAPGSASASPGSTSASGAPVGTASASVGAVSTSVIPDVVLSKAGGSYRGVIIEQTPEGAVRLLLPTGEVRTFAEAEVRWAGRYEDLPRLEPKARPTERGRRRDKAAPSTREASAEQDGTRIPVDLRGEVGAAPVRLHIRKGPEERHLCAIPCSTRLTRGTYTFGVSTDGVHVVETDPANIVSPATVVARLESRRTWRQLGALGMVLGPAFLTAGIFLGRHSTNELQSDGSTVRKQAFDVGWVVGGAAVATALIGGGLFLVFQRDRAGVDVFPKPTAVGLTPFVPGGPGAALTGRF